MRPPRTLLTISLLIVLLTNSCAHLTTRIYTSRDLTSLPCENPERFFFPIEFDGKGERLYPEQWSDFIWKLKDPHLTDAYLFIHGWDKTAQSAEGDYQDFICRFYTRGARGEEGRSIDSQGRAVGMWNTMLAGIFWPSTIFPNWEDPTLIKPISYFFIRERADTLQKTGMQKVFKELLKVAAARQKGPPFLKLHLIGHSFGGRVLVKSLSTFMKDNTSNATEFFEAFKAVNLVLLLPAIPSRDVISELSMEHKGADEGLAQLMKQMRQPGEGVPFSVPRLPKSLHIYNVYSTNDWANRFLFRLGGMLGPDPMECSAGGCGISNVRDVTVTEAGNFSQPVASEWYDDSIWNIEASSVISSHTDIYKGRVANLIWELLARPLDQCGCKCTYKNSQSKFVSKDVTLFSLDCGAESPRYYNCGEYLDGGRTFTSQPGTLEFCSAVGQGPPITFAPGAQVPGGPPRANPGGGAAPPVAPMPPPVAR